MIRSPSSSVLTLRSPIPARFPRRLLASSPCPLSPLQRIVDPTLASGKDHRIVQDGTKQTTGNICYPGTPNPPCILLFEYPTAVSGHQATSRGPKSRAGLKQLSGHLASIPLIQKDMEIRTSLPPCVISQRHTHDHNKKTNNKRLHTRPGGSIGMITQRKNT